MSWAKRWRDLSALDATVADELATPRQRLRCPCAYLRACRPPQGRRDGLTLGAAAQAIRRRALRLLERRRIREMRQPPLAVGTQNLIWLDGEALQVTREFRDELGGQIPPWLNAKKVSGPVSVQTVPLPGSRLAHLVTALGEPTVALAVGLAQAPTAGCAGIGVDERPFPASALRRRPAASARGGPTKRQLVANAVVLAYRATARNNAVAEVPPQCLTGHLPPGHQAGRSSLRQMHQATCYVENDKYDEISGLLTVCCCAKGGHAVALATVHGIEKCPHPNPVRDSTRPGGSGASSCQDVQPDRSSSRLARLRRPSPPELCLETVCRGCWGDWRGRGAGGGSRHEGRSVAPFGAWRPPGPATIRLAGVCRRDWADRIMEVTVTDDFHAKQGRSTGRWISNGAVAGWQST